MTITEYLNKHTEINRDEFWRKVRLQYTKYITEDSTLTNYMAWMDKPFWEVERMYDIAWNKGEVDGNPLNKTTYEFMVDTEYDPVLDEWFKSGEAERWYADWLAKNN